MAVLARRVAESRARSYAYRVSAAAVAADEMEAASAAVKELIEAAEQVYAAWTDHEDWNRLQSAISRVKGE